MMDLILTVLYLVVGVLWLVIGLAVLFGIYKFIRLVEMTREQREELKSLTPQEIKEAHKIDKNED